MKSLSYLFAFFCAALTTLPALGQTSTLYSNYGTDLRRFLDETNSEAGDQITLAANTPRFVNTFTFEYFLKPSQAVGTETVRIRFYANDGELISPDDSSRAPSTLLYDSGSLAIQNAGQSRITLEDLGVTVPDSFTWTAQFAGGNVSSGQVAGLELYSPPTIGSNRPDFWEKTGNTWELFHWDEFASDFGASVVTVPEPGVTSLLLLGMGSLAATVRRRRAY